MRGAAALAVLVAVIMYRALSDNPRLMGALLVAGLSVGAVTGAIWITPSVAETFVTISSGEECNSQKPFSDTGIYPLTNNCAEPVTVIYEVLQSSACSAGGVPDLECKVIPGENPDRCVSDGGSVSVGQARQFLVCYP